MKCLPTFVLALMVPLPCLTAEEDSAAEESITVSVIGKIQTGIMAIGGETTGTIIKVKGITLELDFGRNAELRRSADKLNGKLVSVTGSLERRAGIEIKERWIVAVKSLKASAPMEQ